jgi:hypothetical protein
MSAREKRHRARPDRAAGLELPERLAGFASSAKKLPSFDPLKTSRRRSP